VRLLFKRTLVIFKDSRLLSSSVSTVSADEIARQSALHSQNALQGQAAGVQVTGSNGKPGAAAFVTVRGAVSITGGSAQAIYALMG
jgi:outer membrane receptor for ferrienterochelin and colicin